MAVTGGVVAATALVPTPAGAAPASADLSVTVSHGPASPINGEPLTVTVSATNAGPDAAAKVILGVSLGYPLRFVSGGAGCTALSYDAPSVLCDVGTVASGATATRTITLKPYSAGVYTLPAAVSSTTADPDSADLATTDTVIVRKGPTQGERYVRGEFPKVFGRTPDSATVAFWAARWKAANVIYPRRIVDVPTAWLQSTEARRGRIREAYDRILGRAASSSEITYWTNQLVGGLSYEAVERRLITSAEFTAHHPGSAAVPAAIQVALGRPGTSAEVAGARQRLAGGATLASVVLGFQRSTPGYDVVISRAFHQVLDRAPKPLDRYIWQGRLRDGYTPDRLTAMLLVSNEVLVDYPTTSDDYGEGYYEYDQGIDAATGLPVYDFSR